ncbi:right-handed parallel beta-helix repeat-containing protein [Cellulomonas sp. PhB150]|uniref:right-handed parallel beta-helix repeat-containing protein n=1 Tax=Cellulomonas sp. PhB150 TaxID=2485188 RepID=UPI000F496F14|nr:right-handed parallel beta-helix repeat-containing protein [Cellulomonas sp. PhB150]ROS23735.1 parallel beta helix pectate lyase-like protein [Cellulomonas sp. PhB150]
MLRVLASIATLVMLLVGAAPRASASTASPVTYVGHGTARSCTPAALAKAVRGGGTVKFRCGPQRVTIVLDRTLVVCNTTTCQHPFADPSAKVVERLVLDGGGKVTLSGANKRPILYANTCQESFGWLDAHCDTQTTPHIVVKNLVMQKGNATKAPTFKGHRLENLRGGGAIAMRGGHLTVQHVTFRDNRCIKADSDAGGGAVRLVGQRVRSKLVDSTFVRNRCANGGAVSSLQAPMLLSRSTLTDNVATGSGTSSGKGGNGGAVYFDGTKQAVTVDRSTIQRNRAPEGGPGVFYVSNDWTGTLTITHSKVTKNTGASFWTGKTRSIFFLGKRFVRSGSTIT